MAGSTTLQYISKDAVAALREFSSDFDQALALGEVQVWATALGSAVLVKTSRAIKTTYPIPVSAAGYRERKGDDKMRRLFEKSLDMTPREWQDGVVEKARVLEAPDFSGWGTEPSRIAKEEQRMPNTLLAEVLESSAALDFYKETAHAAKGLFDNSHPCNIFGEVDTDFDNDRGTLVGAANVIKDFRKNFRSIKGPNDKPMGRRLTDILVPAALEEVFFEFLQSDLMYNAQLEGGDNTNIVSNNIYKGAVNLIVSDELSSDTVVYGIDRNGPAFAVLQDGGSPEEITYDKNSDMYKDQGLVGIKFVKELACKAALPHSIQRATYSAT
jgi:phage major head subunit gpT-like protein